MLNVKSFFIVSLGIDAIQHSIGVIFHCPKEFHYNYTHKHTNRVSSLWARGKTLGKLWNRRRDTLMYGLLKYIYNYTGYSPQFILWGFLSGSYYFKKKIVVGRAIAI